MSVNKKRNIFIINFFILQTILITKAQPQMEVYFSFNEIDSQRVYCDENNNLFPSYINAFTIKNDKKISIDINSKMKYIDNKYCQKLIIYSTDSINETILIEFNKTPINLKGFFELSTSSSIKINSNNMDYEQSYYCMFCDCSKLTSIDLSSFDFSNAKNISYMFLNCYNLEEIILPKEIKISIQDLSFMFTGCKKLTSIKLNGDLNCINPSSTNSYLNSWFSNSYISKINFFNFKINCPSNLFMRLNTLSECLYYEYDSNTKKCSNYIGFHKCSGCNNDNTEEICTKTIEGTDYNFYYLDEQFNLPYNERECYWSYNFNKINNSLRFINNGNNSISYYSFKCKDYCKKCSLEKGCLECDNEMNYYKKENEPYNCYNEAPEDNYALDIENKEWRKCLPRCKRCSVPSKLEDMHKCFSCTDNYYTFQTDYDNYINKNLSFNCYNLSEIENNYRNYFMNGKNYLEKCDISCKECKNKNDCKICNANYYYISGYKNGTCFHFPLLGYGLINNDGEIFFQKCYEKCSYCSQVTESFLYPQCTQCNGNYILDEFSYNKSYCIPRDDSSSSLTKNQKKWYVENYEEFEELNLIDKDIIEFIDYERLLNNKKFNKLKFKEVTNCPEDKKYIIYSIRQCVSSCNSLNLIENGLFMTKKLYMYNDICYDECPYASINISDICLEINQYTFTKNITINSFKENNINNILFYLDKFANNSVGITRADDFSNYFYNQSINNTFKMEIQMPIVNFTECLEKMKREYLLNNNTNNIDIFIGILEYNDHIINYINSTKYQFFTNDGTILNQSICIGLFITVEKKVDVNYFNVTEFNKKYNISIYENFDKLNNECTPLSINNKDLSPFIRKLLIKKNKKLCDDDCHFHSFDMKTSYSTCICPIKYENDDKDIKEKIIEELKDSEIFRQIHELSITSNYKYLKCMSKEFFKNNKLYLIIPSLFLFLFYIFSLCIFRTKTEEEKNKKKEEEEEEDKKDEKKGKKKEKKRKKKENENDIITVISETERAKKLKYNSTNDIDSSIEQEPKKDKIKYCDIFKYYFSQKFFFGFIRISQNEKDFPCVLKLIYITIFIHNYFFINVFLFSEKYISLRYLYGESKNIQYLLTKEFDRIIYVFIVTKFINAGLELLLRFLQEYNFLVLFRIVIFALHFFYLYFTFIFANINYNIQKGVLLSYLYTLIPIELYNIIISLIISALLYAVKEIKKGIIYEEVITYARKKL